MKKDKPEASSEVSPEASPAGSANTSQVETTKIEMGSNKQFQCQVLKLKILKGLGAQNPQPCSKADGYLSIENQAQIVFRTLAGRVLFTASINKKSAKIKVCEQTGTGLLKHKIKFTAVVATPEAGKIAVEHLEAKFIQKVDMDNFEQIYKQISS